MPLSVAHYKTSVVSDSRIEQLLKQVIMVSFLCSCSADNLQMLVHWATWRNIYQRKMHFQRVGNIQTYTSLYNRIVSMLFNIQSDTSVIFCGLCLTVSNYKVCHSSHINPMLSLFITIKYWHKNGSFKKLKLWENHWWRTESCFRSSVVKCPVVYFRTDSAGCFPSQSNVNRSNSVHNITFQISIYSYL